jgi:hypothetical protein
MLIEHTESPIGIAEYHQVLAEQSRPHRRTVGLLDLFGHAQRRPMAAHELAHWRITLYAAQQFIFFGSQHR